MQGIAPEDWVQHHREVLERLCVLAQVEGVATHEAGLKFTSVMLSFLMHNVASARSLLTWLDAAGDEWFPVAQAYAVARVMFETDVAAHCICDSPAENAHRYILFEHVLAKRAMDACKRHLDSEDAGWREAMSIEWESHWAERQPAVDAAFDQVKSQFTRPNGQLFNNWSGRSLRSMAQEVAHLEAYDTFYARLSSFAHGDVLSMNRFLRLSPDGPFWTQRANWPDVGEVLHDAASFLACFLSLFGQQFGTWDDAAVEACWSPAGGSNKGINLTARSATVDTASVKAAGYA